MTGQAELSALRERVGRIEVEVEHQSERLKEHARYFEMVGRRMESQTARSGSIEQRLSNIEQLLNVFKWGLMTIATMMLESLTGTIQSALKLAAALGSGS